ncbi:MAG TPA: hypothetical protein VHB20_11155 [Verrucomicrobiae bacterium]|jgi:hypothetical protein|nr:hypothetical protein [Verrucomicrobiae bacterium]
MKKVRLVALALAGALSHPSAAPAQFATSVVSYNAGLGFSAGFTNAAAALGAPAAGSSVNPLSPPFSKSQLVSLGTNGSLTLEFDPPIVNNPSDPFGVDFIIFENSFFQITNGNFSGGGITSGAIGGNNPGATRVAVSADGAAWFTLNPNLAPTVDGIFPTDGFGDPQIPTDPALLGADFAGLGLPGIRALYQGSAGGTGFDLAWAQDSNGVPVNLPIARYVRIDVLTGKSEVDAIAETRGATPCLAEDFVNNPANDGWKIFGDTNLFQWNPVNHELAVTWDSSQANSYFYHPLGSILTTNDDFSVSFDLVVNDNNASGSFELAVGLLNFAEASSTNFSRATGAAPDVFEFDYFPDGGYGPSIDATVSDSTVTLEDDSHFYFAYDELPLALGTTFHVTLSHAAGQAGITGEVTTNGALYSAVDNLYPGPITQLRLDTVAIMNYSAAGDTYGDSLLAHGTVKNIVVALPLPPVRNFAGGLAAGAWQGQFLSRSNWIYTVQKSANLQNWSNASPALPGTGALVNWQDTNAAAAHLYYRVSAAPAN